MKAEDIAAPSNRLWVEKDRCMRLASGSSGLLHQSRHLEGSRSLRMADLLLLLGLRLWWKLAAPCVNLIEHLLHRGTLRYQCKATTAFQIWWGSVPPSLTQKEYRSHSQVHASHECAT